MLLAGDILKNEDFGQGVEGYEQLAELSSVYGIIPNCPEKKDVRGFVEAEWTGRDVWCAGYRVSRVCPLGFGS